MFDIVCCKADAEKHGFAKFYFSDDVRIAEADNNAAAVKYKNQKTLVRLKDYAFDEGAIKIIAEKKNSCFLIDVSQIIRSEGIRRAILISKLRSFLQFCNRYGAYYAFASFARNEDEIRNAEELQHIAMLLGINKGQARFALKMLQHYASM